MKKMRLFFVLAAIMISAAGVFANKNFATVYFQSLTANDLNCTASLVGGLGANCDEGSAQCFKDVPSGMSTTRWYITQKINEGPCIVVPHP